jgi:hypothetical protein
MRTPSEHIKTLQRRIDFLKSRPHQNSFDLAELGSLEWALINLQLKQEQGEPVAKAWAEGYRMGISDERTSEANIGIAGFNAKIEPDRQNPYGTPQPKQEQGEPVAFVIDRFQGQNTGSTMPEPQVIWIGRIKIGDKLYTHPQPEAEKQEQGEPVAVKHMMEWVAFLKARSDNGQHKQIPSNLSAGTCWDLAVELEQFINTTSQQPKRERVLFPTMLRRMWSGGDVQEWLDKHVNGEDA